MKVISVDLGATSGRVRIVKEDNGILSYEEIHRFLNKSYRDKEGTLRWDFSYLFNEVVKGISLSLEKYPDAASIGIDTWGVDYGLLDQKGELLSDPVCYRDEGTFESQRKLLEKVSYQEIYSITGIQNRHFNTIYQLYVEKSDFKKVSTLLLRPDLIAYFLTGKRRREETNASTTSLYSRKEKKISSQLLNRINVPERIFPQRIYPGEEYGLRKDEFLPEGRKHSIPVLAVTTHDTASAVLGSNGKYPVAYLSSGTWSLLGTELNNPFRNKETYKANFTNEIGYGSTIRFLKNTRGRFLINEVRNDYQKKGIKIPVSSIAKLVKESKDLPTYLNADDPAFETPGNRLDKIDSYLTKTNQEKPATPGERRKIIYTSRAMTYRRILDKLIELTGEKIDSLLVVGGGNQAVILNQYTADAINKPVITGSSEATVLGNSLCQFIHFSVFKDREEGREAIGRSIESQTFYPEETNLWNEKYQSYLKIIGKGESHE